MLNTETPSAEALRLARTHGEDALALIAAPFLMPERSNVDTLIYWRARLAARAALAYLGIAPRTIETVTHHVDFDANREWLEIRLSDGDRYACDVYPYLADWSTRTTSDPTSENHRIAMQQFDNWRPL